MEEVVHSHSNYFKEYLIVTVTIFKKYLIVTLFGAPHSIGLFATLTAPRNTNLTFHNVNNISNLSYLRYFLKSLKIVTVTMSNLFPNELLVINFFRWWNIFKCVIPVIPHNMYTVIPHIICTAVIPHIICTAVVPHKMCTAFIPHNICTAVIPHNICTVHFKVSLTVLM